jgi:peptidoglycan/xylan/chitin deacetylase (PgdA/CDA1 family)
MLIRKFEERPKAVITVDDGFADNFEIMMPVVRALEVPITVFLATDFLDTGQPPWPTMIKAIIQGSRSERMEYPFSASLRTAADRSAALAHIKTIWRGLGLKERGDAIAEFGRHLRAHSVRTPRPLTWEQVRQMRQQGITFGSHTVHHSMLPFVAASQARWELVQSRRRIEEELKEPCHWFAYPNGDYDDSSMSLVTQAGYLAALTQERGINHPGAELMALHRIEVPKDESLGCFACRASLVAI